MGAASAVPGVKWAQSIIISLPFRRYVACRIY